MIGQWQDEMGAYLHRMDNVDVPEVQYLPKMQPPRLAVRRHINTLFIIYLVGTHQGVIEKGSRCISRFLFTTLLVHSHLYYDLSLMSSRAKVPERVSEVLECKRAIDDRFHLAGFEKPAHVG